MMRNCEYLVNRLKKEFWISNSDTIVLVWYHNKTCRKFLSVKSNQSSLNEESMSRCLRLSSALSPAGAAGSVYSAPSADWANRVSFIQPGCVTLVGRLKGRLSGRHRQGKHLSRCPEDSAFSPPDARSLLWLSQETISVEILNSFFNKWLWVSKHSF